MKIQVSSGLIKAIILLSFTITLISCDSDEFDDGVTIEDENVSSYMKLKSQQA
jgi:hypothetical protein